MCVLKQTNLYKPESRELDCKRIDYLSLEGEKWLLISILRNDAITSNVQMISFSRIQDKPWAL